MFGIKPVWYFLISCMHICYNICLFAVAAAVSVAVLSIILFQLRMVYVGASTIQHSIIRPMHQSWFEFSTQFIWRKKPENSSRQFPLSNLIKFDRKRSRRFALAATSERVSMRERREQQAHLNDEWNIWFGRFKLPSRTDFSILFQTLLCSVLTHSIHLKCVHMNFFT